VVKIVHGHKGQIKRRQTQGWAERRGGAFKFGKQGGAGARTSAGREERMEQSLTKKRRKLEKTAPLSEGGQSCLTCGRNVKVRERCRAPRGGFRRHPTCVDAGKNRTVMLSCERPTEHSDTIGTHILEIRIEVQLRGEQRPNCLTVFKRNEKIKNRAGAKTLKVEVIAGPYVEVTSTTRTKRTLKVLRLPSGREWRTQIRRIRQDGENKGVETTEKGG